MGPRPIATICCSPPDIVPHTWLIRCPRQGTADHPGDVLVTGAPAAEPQVVSNGQAGKSRAASGTCAMPTSTICSIDRPRRSLPRNDMTSALALAMPDSARSSEVFPAPFGPTSDDLLAAHKEVDLPEHLDPAVSRGQVVHLKHLSHPCLTLRVLLSEVRLR